MAIFPSQNLQKLFVCYQFGYIKARLSTLCRHPNINVFSKWKPIDYNGDTINLSILQNENYGLQLLQANNVEALVSLIKQGNTYIYHKPKGSQSSPFRLGDFRNYNPDALEPCQPMGQMTIDNGGEAVTGLVSITNPTGSSTEIGFNDLYKVYDNTGRLAKLNRGVYMETPSGKTAWATNEIVWKNIRFPGDFITNTAVTVYDFFTNVSKTIDGVHVGSGNDIFVAVAALPVRPNPFTWFLTGKEPAGSRKYFFKVVAIATSDGNIEVKVTMSSMGEIYRGGTARNIAWQLRTDRDYTSGQQVGGDDITAEYAIGEEEEKTWTYNTRFPSGYRTLYVFVFADQVKMAQTAVLIPME